MIIGLIPARGGSKGVPNKNIRKVAGKPLIAHTIGCGKQSSLIDHVIVSTDSEFIAEIAKGLGAEVPFIRPDNLATDGAVMLPVMQHAIEQSERCYGQTVELLVLLEPTGPLRSVNDIEHCIKTIWEHDCDAVISGKDTHCNPYYNAVKDNNEYVEPVCALEQSIGRRQDAPNVYDLLPIVWVYKRKALMDEKARLPKKTKLYRVPNERSIDLDTEEDFQYLDYLLNRGLATL